MPVGPHAIDIHYSFASFGDSRSSNEQREIACEIVAAPLAGESEDKEIGRLDIHLIEVSKAGNHFRLFDYSGDSMDFYQTVVQGGLLEDWARGDDYFHINDISLVPAARGKDISLDVVYRAIEDLCGKGYLPILYAGPNERDCRDDDDEDAHPGRGRAIAQGKLRKHWRKLGFKRIGSTNWMALDRESDRSAWHRFQAPDRYDLDLSGVTNDPEGSSSPGSFPLPAGDTTDVMVTVRREPRQR